MPPLHPLRWSRPRGTGLILAAALAAGPGRAAATPDDVPVKSVTPEEFAAEQNSAKHYTFELAWPDGLTDEQGTHVAAADELAYLNERKLDAAEYVLLVITNQSPPLARVAPEVNPLGRYGFKKIVFKHKDGDTPMVVAAEYHSPASATALAVIPAPGAEPRTVGGGDPFPNLDARPPDLRPGALPPRTRYTFSPDMAVINASARVMGRIFAPTASDLPLWAGQVEVRSGAWATLKGPEPWAPEAAVRTQALDPGTGKPVLLEGRLLHEPADIATLEEKLRALAAPGGGAVHAPTAAELARLGPFVNYTFVEPILFLQTSDQAHDFALIFTDGRLVAVDDLKGLPTLP